MSQEHVEKAGIPDQVLKQLRELRDVAQLGAAEMITEDNFPDIAQQAPSLLIHYRLIALREKSEQLYDIRDMFPGSAAPINGALRHVALAALEQIRSLPQVDAEEYQLPLRPNGSETTLIRMAMDQGLADVLSSQNLPSWEDFSTDQKEAFITKAYFVALERLRQQRGLIKEEDPLGFSPFQGEPATRNIDEKSRMLRAKILGSDSDIAS